MSLPFPHTGAPTPRADPPGTRALVHTLSLSPHPEGGFFRRLHEHASLKLPSSSSSASSSSSTTPEPVPASSSIHYLLTPSSPVGHFHSNQHLTYHFLHRGRGRYVLVHPDTGEVESFVVGHGDGEKLMWVVEGGVWKASYLLAEEEEGRENGAEKEEGEGLLISEVVVPSWTMEQHRFLGEEELRRLVGEERAAKLCGLLKKQDEKEGEDEGEKKAVRN